MEEKFYIQKELQEIAPKLSKLEKPQRQDPEDAYFTTVQQSVIAKIADQVQEEHKLESYFDALPGKVLAKVKPKSNPTMVKWRIGFAASLLLVLTTVFVLKQQTTKIESTNLTSFVDELEDEEVIYLLSQITTATDLAVISDYRDDEIDIPQNIEDADLLQYLNESDLMQNIDLQ